LTPLLCNLKTLRNVCSSFALIGFFIAALHPSRIPECCEVIFNAVIRLRLFDRRGASKCLFSELINYLPTERFARAAAGPIWQRHLLTHTQADNACVNTLPLPPSALSPRTPKKKQLQRRTALATTFSAQQGKCVTPKTYIFYY
jgi:hypothetical protein